MFYLSIGQCSTCQYGKAEHQRPTGTLQPLLIPEWKWEEINIDFVTRLPKAPSGEDAIWVLVDRLTKTAHFILMKVKDPMKKLASLYVQNRIPSVIVSNRHSWFTLRFW